MYGLNGSKEASNSDKVRWFLKKEGLNRQEEEQFTKLFENMLNSVLWKDITDHANWLRHLRLARVNLPGTLDKIQSSLCCFLLTYSLCSFILDDGLMIRDRNSCNLRCSSVDTMWYRFIFLKSFPLDDEILDWPSKNGSKCNSQMYTRIKCTTLVMGTHVRVAGCVQNLACPPV